MQQYIDDIEDMTEGIPDIVVYRLQKISAWDAKVNELEKECNVLKEYLLDPTTPKDAVFNAKAMVLAEKMSKMREFSEKKVDLAEKNTNLLTSLYQKVCETAYHFKLELEVDNPGCTEIREQMVCRSLNLRRGKSDPQGNDVVDEDRSFRWSPSNNEPNVTRPEKQSKRGVGRPRNVFKENVFNEKQMFSPSNSRHSSIETDENRKKKRGMSAYMRRKTERMREQNKMVEVETHEKRKQLVDRRNKSDLGSRNASTNSLRNSSDLDLSDVKREISETPTDISPGEWNGECIEDEEDLMEAFGFGIDSLPSPPREIMESLDNANMFSFDYSASNQSDPKRATEVAMDDVEASSQYSDCLFNFPSLGIQSGALDGVSGVEKYNLANPVQLAQMNRDLAERRLHEDKNKAKNKALCHCNRPSEGSLVVSCNNESCRIKWFHFGCVGLTEMPRGQWFCFECRGA